MGSEKVDWAINGELALNCNCTVFCPCAVSLGDHPPTEGYCQTWLAVRIDNGHFRDVDLSGLNVGMLMEIPGKMARGNWTIGAFIDDSAGDEAFDALDKIFSGKVGGTTGLFSILTGTYLGSERSPVEYKTEGEKRIVNVGKKIQGVIKPIEGLEKGEPVTFQNSTYWMGPEVIISTAEQGRVRAFGRVWDFEGRSAELCKIKWGTH